MAISNEGSFKISLYYYYYYYYYHYYISSQLACIVKFHYYTFEETHPISRFHLVPLFLASGISFFFFLHRLCAWIPKLGLSCAEATNEFIRRGLAYLQFHRAASTDSYNKADRVFHYLACVSRLADISLFRYVERWRTLVPEPRGELSRWQVAWRVLTFVFSKEVDTFVKRKEGTKVTRTGGEGGVEARGWSEGRLIRNVDQIQSPIQRVIIQRW